MSIFKTLFKDTFIYGLAMVLPKLLNLLLNYLYTDILENEGFSEVISFYVYAGFINVLLTYGMETAFFRFYNKSEKKEEVYTTALISLLITLIVFVIISLIFKIELALFLKIPTPIFLMLVGLVAFDILAVIPFAYYRVKGKAFSYAGIRVFSMVIVFAFFNFFFLKWVPEYRISLPEIITFENKETYVFLSNFIANASMVLLIFPSYFRFKWKFDKIIFKQMRQYGAPILIAGLAFLIVENLDKLILRDLLSKELMGAYGACYKLGIFLTLFIQAFRMGVEPFFFNQAGKSNAKESYAVVLKFFVIFASLGILIVLSFLDLFVSLIISKKSFLITISIVPVILIANWCFGVYQSLSVWYKVTDKTKYGMYFTIFGAVITIAFNYILIPVMGYMAAAYATLVSYGSMMLLSYFYGRKKYRVPYPIVRILSYLFLALALSVLTWYLYPKNYLLKFGAILVYLSAVIFLEKESIKRLLKNPKD